MATLPQPTPWPPAQLPLPLDDGCVHVCLFSLDLSEARLTELLENFDENERARAARFLTEKSRRQFIAARGQMRAVLAAQLGQPPASLRLAYTTQGKPFLPDHALRFNLSHSGSLALLALSRTQELGVDVEETSRTVDYATIAKRFFATAESATLEALPPEEQRMAFFRCWTRKEAYIKAHGEGLGIPLASFQVTLTAHEPPRLTGVEPGWQLYALEPGAGYTAALVTLGRPPGIRCWSCSPD